MKKAFRPPFFRSLPGLLGATALGLFAMSAQAMAADPIKIGVIAEAQAIAMADPGWMPHCAPLNIGTADDADI